MSAWSCRSLEGSTVFCGAPVMTTSPETRLKRFLHYGRETGLYQPGNRLLQDYYVRDNLGAINTLVTEGKATETVSHIVKVTETVSHIVKVTETVSHIVKVTETVSHIVKVTETVSHIVKVTETVSHIVKAFSDGYSAHPESLVFALAMCARTDNQALQQAAYNAVKTVCKAPRFLFLFVMFNDKLADPVSGQSPWEKEIQRGFQPLAGLWLLYSCR
uniref:Uncharacterized protein n=1 Tax=Timema poppense TaxID=170557 RepID=A0A7R9HH51_TIMPO|nr:unnamed protein product [Timema poppensis]